jgi:multiple sugar transport system substrate-binding protein
MQSRNPTLFTFTLIVLLSLLAACKNQVPSEPPATQVTEKVTLTFACYAEQENIYRDLADQFEAGYPGIHVQLVRLEHGVSSLNEIVKQADTLIMPAFFPALSHGLVRDLEPFIAQDTTFQPQDFYTHTLESLQWEGGTWGIPASIHFQMIFYDRRDFDAAGVPYPAPGWTWDDFLSTAQALTQREGDRVVRWGFDWRQRDPLPFIQGRAGTLVDTSGEGPTPLLDRPAVAEATRWFTDLALAQRVMYYPQAPGPEEEVRAAMWNDSTRNWRGPGTEIGPLPFPVDAPASATTPVELEMHVMSAGTAHPQEAWRWLSFLSRQVTGTGVPARRSLAGDYWATLDANTTSAYRFALAHGFSPLDSLWLGSSLHDALDAVLQQEISVEQALAQAQVKAAAYMAGELNEVVASAEFTVPTPAPTNDAGSSIVFIVTQSYWSKEETYQTLAEQFHALHPEIAVEVKAPDLPTGISIVTLQQIASQGDCLSVFSPFLWSDTDALLDLSPMVEADATLPVDDFYPSFLEALRYEGRLWALPSEGYPRVMCYNKELFDAAGLSYPAADWTLDDFMALAAALTQGGGADGRYGYTLSPDFLAEPAFFVEQHGAQLARGDAGADAITLDTPAMAEAIRWYAALMRDYGVSLTMDESNPGPTYERWQYLVERGRTAMWSIHPVGTYDTLWGGARKPKVQVGMVPMPQGPGQVGDFLLLGYSISAHTQHPQACWEWMKFLSAQPLAIEGVPARRSVAASEVYRQQIKPELRDIYQATLEQSERLLTSATRLNTDRTRFVLGQFSQAVEVALNGGDVEQALATAQDKVEQYFLCLETTTGYADEQDLIHTCTSRAETGEQ